MIGCPASIDHQKLVAAGIYAESTLHKTEVVADSTAKDIFARLMREAVRDSMYTLPYGEIVSEVGKKFIGAEYVGGMLDAPNAEVLVVSLDKFDCVLYVESVLAIAEGISRQNYSYEAFVRRLEKLRYRDGRMRGYRSRLHYFSDWIHENEKRESLVNITKRLGGVQMNDSLSFMGMHRRFYRHFAENDSMYADIIDMEKELRHVPLLYIPKKKIKSIYSQLRPGDIIATSTKVKGLDVSHSGMAVRNENGSIGFMHASTNGGVRISEDLHRYVRANRALTGIVVARPIDKRAR